VLDLVIRGGTLLDGTGAPARIADVGVRDGRIAEIAASGAIPADVSAELPAAGRIVAPGFIDVHVHADALLLSDPDYAAGLRQGVTSVILGNDGIGLAPSSAATARGMGALWAGILGPSDRLAGGAGIGSYLSTFEGSVAPNVGTLLPHGPLRMMVMGLDARPADARELAEMVRMSHEAYAQGALGFSIGLDYVPCRWATRQELVALAEAAAAWNGPFVTHMRDYVDEVEASLAEALDIGSASGAAVHVSHFNVRADRGLPLIDAARAAGRDVTFDLYPYLAGAPSLAFFLPGWIQEGGMAAMLERLADPGVRARLRPDLDDADRRWGWERVVLTDAGAGDTFRWAVGKSIRDAAEERRTTIDALVADVLIASGGAAATVTHHRHRSETDQALLVAHPGHIGASDGVYVGARPHPRGFGTFARYVRMAIDEGALSERVAHLAAAAADRFGLPDRGRIVVGAAADIVVLDPERVRDRATYEAPAQHPDGIEQVLVNGVPVIRDGRPTGQRPGRILRRA